MSFGAIHNNYENRQHNYTAQKKTNGTAIFKQQQMMLSEKIKNISQIQREVAQKIMDIIHKDDFESEEERMRFQTKIESKIKSGAKLSAKEMNYLRKYNPYLYHQMLRVQQKRESLKEQLKHCRTKQEAQQAISFAFSSIGEKDPAREAMVAAVENISKQFCSSAAYERLPNTEEDLKKNKKVEKSVANPFKGDEEDGSEHETILYSFNSTGYQEANIEMAEKNIFNANA